ncbi:MAG: hypothetical protein V4757_07340 [Pseudomonadota bacterium]
MTPWKILQVAGALALHAASVEAQAVDFAQCLAKSSVHTITADKDGAYQACLDGKEYTPGQAQKDADHAAERKALTEACEIRARVAAASGDSRSSVLADCMAGAPYSAPTRLVASHYIDSFGITEVNSAGGVEPYASFVNPNSKSAIKYIRLQMQLYNAVGDVVRSTIGGHSVGTLSYTGPLEAGKEPDGAEWEPIWYNRSGHCVTVTAVSVEFMNGRRESFSGKAVGKALAPGLANDCRVR